MFIYGKTPNRQLFNATFSELNGKGYPMVAIFTSAK